MVSPDETLAVYSYADPYDCRNPAQIGVAKATGAISTTSIPANGLVTLQAKFTRPGNRACVQQWSFQPKDRQSYVLSVQTTETGCATAILNATNPEHLAPEPSAISRSNARQACVPLTEAKAARRAKQNVGSTNDFPSAGNPSAGAMAGNPGHDMDDFKDLLGEK